MVNEMVGVVLFHVLIGEIYPLHDLVCVVYFYSYVYSCSYVF